MLALLSWPASVHADVDGGDGGDDAAIADAAPSDATVSDASNADASKDASMDACTTPCTCVPCTTRPDTGDDEVGAEPDNEPTGGCSCEAQGGGSSPLASMWLIAVLALVWRARTRRRSS
jgi:MYXO-CTERM domain-containing protein